MNERNPTGRKELPLDSQTEHLYGALARDPVAFFERAEGGDAPLELEKVIKVLYDFRRRVNVPVGEVGRLSLTKSTVDRDLIRFSEQPNYETLHYEGLFRILQRLGFNLGDAVLHLLKNIDLKKNSQDVDVMPQILDAARVAVEKGANRTQSYRHVDHEGQKPH